MPWDSSMSIRTQQNRIRWNERAIINELKLREGWSEEKIRHNVINRLDVSQTNFSAFDPNSIMLYTIPNRWTIGNFETRYNTTLSAGDKRFISTLYRQTAPPTRPMGNIVSVRTEHNQTENRRKGMRIRATFEVDHFKGKTRNRLCILLSEENGTPLKDRNGHYWSSEW